MSLLILLSLLCKFLNSINSDSDKLRIEERKMPAKDIFHDVVKKSLVKQGWIITDDPLLVQFRDIDLYVDLGAEKMIAAEKNGKKLPLKSNLL
jgi:hypothetical protein